MQNHKLTIYLIALALMATGARALTLGDALDNTNLTWTTGCVTNSGADPTYYPYPTNWFAYTSTGIFDNSTFDGVDSAISGNRYLANSDCWLSTTVVGPGTLSFWWKVDSVPPDALEFSINGVLQESLAGEAINGDNVNWQYRLYSIPAGTNVLQWDYVKDDSINAATDQGYLDQVIYTTNPPIALQDALNTCGLTWTSGGNTNPTYWSGQTNVTHDGSKAAQSGAIFDSQASWMQTTVSSATNVSFWWKVSSETNADRLYFIVDNTTNANISGEVNWKSNYFVLTKTNHTLTWLYAKNGQNVASRGQDRGWVDQVVVNPPIKAFPYTLSNPVSLPDGSFQFSVVGEVGCPCRLQYSTDFGQTNWTTVTNLTTTSNTVFTDSTSSNSPARFYRALSP